MNDGLRQAAADLQGYLVERRRDFHRHPELSFQERRTARQIAEELGKIGLEVRTGIADTGVLAILPGARPGRTVLLRADIDALPIQEVAESPYRSQNDGVMHACGHDGHTAIALGAARVLAAYSSEIVGTVKLVFQPAEERAGGAEPMIAAGVMEDPHVDRVLGLHIWNGLPAGQVGVRGGPLWASVDEFEITVRGRGGHGAMPHQTVDSVAVAAQVITALQTLVSREVSPLDTAVVTVGKIAGGTARNVIAPEVTFSGTIRAFLSETRQMLHRRIEEIARGVCGAMRAEMDYQLEYCCPAVVNDEEMSQRVARSAARVLGESRVILSPQSMVGDDMSLFLNAAPGCYFMLGGARRQGEPYGPHHNNRFDFEEDVLADGVAVLCQATLDLLSAE
jgi:amidohydrolase